MRLFANCIIICEIVIVIYLGYFNKPFMNQSEHISFKLQVQYYYITFSTLNLYKCISEHVTLQELFHELQYSNYR